MHYLPLETSFLEPPSFLLQPGPVLLESGLVLSSWDEPQLSPYCSPSCPLYLILSHYSGFTLSFGSLPKKEYMGDWFLDLAYLRWFLFHLRLHWLGMKCKLGNNFHSKFFRYYSITFSFLLWLMPFWVFILYMWFSSLLSYQNLSYSLCPSRAISLRWWAVVWSFFHSWVIHEARQSVNLCNLKTQILQFWDFQYIVYLIISFPPFSLSLLFPSSCMSDFQDSIY